MGCAGIGLVLTQEYPGRKCVNAKSPFTPCNSYLNILGHYMTVMYMYVCTYMKSVHH